MAEKRSRKYREKVKCSICKKVFNSDYKDKHSETMHKGGKVKYSYVLEGQSQLTFTPKRLRTEEHIFEGCLPVESESLADNFTENEEDAHVICDNDSTRLPNTTSGNVEDINIVANSDDHENNNDEFYKSESKFPVTQMDSVSLSNDTLDCSKQPILKSYDPKKFGNENATRDFNSKEYNDHPWLAYSVEDKTASCYACQKFICKEFVISNWKKPERFIKHHKSQSHGITMAK